MQTADILSVDNIEKSQVTTIEQNRDDMNNFSQETPFRKPRTKQCGKRKRKPDEFELRIIKELKEENQPNLHLSGHDSSVGIATRYGLDGPGIESRWGRDFPHLSRPALEPTQPPVQWVPGLSWG